MVVVERMTFNHLDKTVKAELFADTATEVTSSMTVPEVPAGYTLGAGSIVRTPAFEVGTLNSEGTWSWA